METLQQAADGMGTVVRLAGVNFREASRRMARGVYLMAMAFHGSHEVTTGPGEAMLVCRGCWPVRAWPCDHYETAERGRAEVEAKWAQEDLAAGR